MSDFKVAHLQKREQLEGVFKERLGGRWSDSERILTEAAFDDDVLNLFLEATQGEKSRLGICYLAVMAWEQFRVKSVPAVARSLMAANSAMWALSNELNQTKDQLKIMMDKIDSIESVARAEKDVTAPPPVVDLQPIEAGVSTLLENMARAEKQREARREEVQADKKKKIELRKADEEAKAAKKAARKSRAKAAKIAKAIRKAALERGENPYTEEETAKFKSALEKKGKKFYTPEQRKNYKDLLQKAGIAAKKPGPNNKKFVRYSAKDKQEFIKKNFTDVGVKYWSASERRAYKAKKKAAKADGDQTPKGDAPPKV